MNNFLSDKSKPQDLITVDNGFSGKIYEKAQEVAINNIISMSDSLFNTISSLILKEIPDIGVEIKDKIDTEDIVEGNNIENEKISGLNDTINKLLFTLDKYGNDTNIVLSKINNTFGDTSSKQGSKTVPESSPQYDTLVPSILNNFFSKVLIPTIKPEISSIIDSSISYPSNSSASFYSKNNTYNKNYDSLVTNTNNDYFDDKSYNISSSTAEDNSVQEYKDNSDRSLNIPHYNVDKSTSVFKDPKEVMLKTEESLFSSYSSKSPEYIKTIIEELQIIKKSQLKSENYLKSMEDIDRKWYEYETEDSIFDKKEDKGVDETQPVKEGVIDKLKKGDSISDTVYDAIKKRILEYGSLTLLPMLKKVILGGILPLASKFFMNLVPGIVSSALPVLFAPVGAAIGSGISGALLTIGVPVAGAIVAALAGWKIGSFINNKIEEGLIERKHYENQAKIQDKKDMNTREDILKGVQEKFGDKEITDANIVRMMRDKSSPALSHGYYKHLGSDYESLPPEILKSIVHNLTEEDYNKYILSVREKKKTQDPAMKDKATGEVQKEEKDASVLVPDKNSQVKPDSVEYSAPVLSPETGKKERLDTVDGSVRKQEKGTSVLVPDKNSQVKPDSVEYSAPVLSPETGKQESSDTGDVQTSQTNNVNMYKNNNIEQSGITQVFPTSNNVSFNKTEAIQLDKSKDTDRFYVNNNYNKSYNKETYKTTELSNVFNNKNTGNVADNVVLDYYNPEIKDKTDKNITVNSDTSGIEKVIKSGNVELISALKELSSVITNNINMSSSSSTNSTASSIPAIRDGFDRQQDRLKIASSL